MSSKKSIRKKKKKQKDTARKLVLKEILELKEKVVDYETEISKQKKQNLKELHIRNLKVFVGTCNLLMPFVLIGGIAVGGIKICSGGYPFYRDSITKCKKYELEFETDSDINLNIGYVNNSWWSDAPPNDSLIMYTPWQKENNSFVRYKRIYDLPSENFNDLSAALFQRNFDYINDNYTRFKEEKQITDSIDEEKNDYYIEAKLYELDSSDTLKYPETEKKNNTITIVEIIIILGGGSLITCKRKYKYLDDLKEINITYRATTKSTDSLEEELEATKKKILTLTKKTGGIYNG